MWPSNIHSAYHENDTSLHEAKLFSALNQTRLEWKPWNGMLADMTWAIIGPLARTRLLIQLELYQKTNVKQRVGRRVVSCSYHDAFVPAGLHTDIVSTTPHALCLWDKPSNVVRPMLPIVRDLHTLPLSYPSIHCSYMPLNVTSPQ